MPSVEDTGEEPLEPLSASTPPALHSAAFSGMPMHIYPFPNALHPAQQPLRSKRRQVKNACTHCQKACKKCDDARPCLRCVKYGISEECVDSQRKERKKGIKRGPYKKRDGKGSSVDSDDADMSQQGMAVSNNILPAGGSGSYMGFPPGFYGQHPVLKQGESPPLVYPIPQYYLASAPPHIQPHDGENHQYAAQGYYPATVLATMPYHPTYAIPRGPIPTPYPAYSAMYPKQSLVDDAPGEKVNGAGLGNEDQEGVNGRA